MIEFELTGEQQSVRDLARTVATGVMGRPDTSHGHGVDPAVWRRLVDTGLVAPSSRDGGEAWLDPLSQVIVAEELARGDADTAAAVLWSGGAARLIAAAGTTTQRSLPAELAADSGRRSSVALYEGFGRAPSEYATTITAQGDEWKLTGRKVGVAYPQQASPMVVVGTDPSEGGRLRAVLLASVDASCVSDTAPLLGLAATPTGSVSFDATVGADDLLGGPDASPDSLARAVSVLRLGAAAVALGCAQRACTYAADYATGRIAFQRPIASFQGVAFLVADAQMRIEAARTQLWRLATEIESLDPDSLERNVSDVVAYSTTVSSDAARDAVQVLGGHGFIADHPVGAWYSATAALSALDCDPARLPLTLAL